MIREKLKSRIITVREKIKVVGVTEEDVENRQWLRCAEQKGWTNLEGS